MASAASWSLQRSMYTWQLPDAAYKTGTVATALRDSFSPSPPLGTIRSTSPVCVASSAISSRPDPETSPRASSGSPTPATADAARPARIALEREAALEPLSTIALPAFRQSAAASIVTFGRASYTTATTPRGTRTLRTSSPFGSRKPSITSPAGSGSAAIVRTPSAIAAILASSSRSFSRNAEL